MIAAIFVDPRGIYSTIDGVECWGLQTENEATPPAFAAILVEMTRSAR